MFHLILGSLTPADGRLRPRLYRFVWLSPIVLLRVPHATFFELEGCKAQGGYIEVPGLDLSGNVGMPRVTPLFPWRHGDKLARCHVPKPRWPEGDDTLVPRDAPGDSVSFHRKGNECNICLLYTSDAADDL